MSDSWINTLIESGAQFSDGRLVRFNAISEEAAMTRAAGVCDLTHYGLIKISGEDAGTFLHAQFTNDVLSLPSAHCQLNGWCSPKGRLLAVFWIWRIDDAYYMLLLKSLQSAIQKRMGMFILRSKVILEDLSGQTVRMGLVRWPHAPVSDDGMPAVGTVATSAHATTVRLTSSRSVLVTLPTSAEAVWRDLCKSTHPLTANEWDLAAINDGIVEVVPETQDTYVPQMANFELVGGLSFKKGCYPGQEIVARTQYRGILKRRMAKVSGLSDTALKPGTPVYSPQFPDQIVGSVALSALNTPTTALTLVVAQLDSIKSDSLYLDAACTPENHLAVESLPYLYPDEHRLSQPALP